MEFCIRPPFDYNDLSPVLSERAVRVHFEDHHLKYEKNLISLIVGTPLEHKSLIEIIETTTSNDVFNNAAQVHNHNMFWQSLTKEKTTVPQHVNDYFKGNFRDKFVSTGTKHFGSGWLWVIQHLNDYVITTSHDAETFTNPEHQIILCIDLWEHAYLYQEQYEANRKAYLEAIINHLDWERAEP